ncbi:MAG: hypothetical protein ACLPUO_06990 [Streptosporangiaceae bacterium]
MPDDEWQGRVMGDLPSWDAAHGALVTPEGDQTGRSNGQMHGARCQGVTAPLVTGPDHLHSTGASGSASRGMRDYPARWLTASMLALALLAAAAAAVSFSAQYQMVHDVKGIAAVAAMDAAIPDVAALIFATLGIALALHGRRAIRSRILNVAAVATSVTMNVLAAGHGWRDLAIWAMPPVAYALASDTAIGVVRAWTIARQKALTGELAADDDATPLALLGALLLWLLRLIVAPASTLAGFRAWVVEECPVAPGRHAQPRQRAARAVVAPPHANASPAGSRPRTSGGGARAGTKTSRFLDLVVSRYGPLEAFPVADVSRVASELAPQAGLHAGAARSVLRRHVLALQGSSR